MPFEMIGSYSMRANHSGSMSFVSPFQSDPRGICPAVTKEILVAGPRRPASLPQDAAHHLWKALWRARIRRDLGACSPIVDGLGWSWTRKSHLPHPSPGYHLQRVRLQRPVSSARRPSGVRGGERCRPSPWASTRASVPPLAPLKWGQEWVESPGHESDVGRVKAYHRTLRGCELLA